MVVDVIKYNKQLKLNKLKSSNIRLNTLHNSSFKNHVLNTTRKSRKLLVKTANYYKFIDGVYDSYWIGKFMNFFLKKGLKKKSLNLIYKTFILLKLTIEKLPLLYLLEILDKVKPLFRLENTFVRRKIYVYPKLASPYKQYKIALKWLSLYLRNKQDKASIVEPLSLYLFNRLKTFDNERKHVLFRKRNMFFKQASMLQDNRRFTWKREY